MKHKLIVIFFLLISLFAFAEEGFYVPSPFLGEWNVKGDDYDAIFVIGETKIYIVPTTEYSEGDVLSWACDGNIKYFMIDGTLYKIENMSYTKDSFKLVPVHVRRSLKKTKTLHFERKYQDVKGG